MALLGSAALAMWWNVAPEVRAELEHWHAHEHFPERLSLPGFRRASRWTATDGGEGFFVMYELEDAAVLASPAYLARLNAPSPWSTRMMPLHRQMMRMQCQVRLSVGAVTARHALTIRCAPVDGDATALLRALAALAPALTQQPGLVGLHLLQHQASAIPVTTEQRIRGLADTAADWVIVVTGYDADALWQLAATTFDEAGLPALGLAPSATRELHALAYSATPADMR